MLHLHHTAIMTRLPAIGDLVLTDTMDSSKTSLPEPSTNKAESEGSRLLPSLKDTVGSAYSAQRPLQPQPDPSHPVPELFIPGVSVLYLDDLPIRTYTVGGFRYNMAQPKNETKSEFSRKTVDGRQITYALEVVQQPEKARACGSGVKCEFCLHIQWTTFLTLPFSDAGPPTCRPTTSCPIESVQWQRGHHFRLRCDVHALCELGSCSTDSCWQDAYSSSYSSLVGCGRCQCCLPGKA